MDATEEGDTLVIGAGTYVEAITIDKQLDIVGEERRHHRWVDAQRRTDGASQGWFQRQFDQDLETVAGSDQGNAVSRDQPGVKDVALSDNTFDAGGNTSGSVVYLNPRACRFTFEGNTFLGEDLSGSPLLASRRIWHHR